MQMTVMTLKAARRKRGWTLEQLAEASGVHLSTCSRLERGETQPMHGTAQALEAALKCKLAFGSPSESVSA